MFPQEASDKLCAGTSSMEKGAEYRDFPKRKLERDASVASVMHMTMTSFYSGSKNFRLY